MSINEKKPVTEYAVVVGDPWDPESFTKGVNEKLRDGWVLHGTPALGGDGSEGNVIAQALCREIAANSP